MALYAHFTIKTLEITAVAGEHGIIDESVAKYVARAGATYTINATTGAIQFDWMTDPDEGDPKPDKFIWNPVNDPKSSIEEGYKFDA